MSLNRFMHKRNPFKNKRIDFKDLCSKYAFVKDALCDDHGEIIVDFKSPAHLATICRALLLDSFSLEVVVPLDRLIPTVPLRMNYLLWIEDILQSSLSKTNKDVLILDIGAGAVCIYGLLGARVFGWRFISTELNKDNIATARNNITNNNLNDLIQILPVSESESEKSILRPVFSSKSDLYIDIVMCNPPFFGSMMDKSGGLNTRNMEERDEARSANSSHRNESIVEGGELQFTQRLVDESVQYKNNIGIFTVMLGKKSSSDKVRHYLQEKGISNHSIYEMCQGRVMRWGVAWSYLLDFIHPKSEFQLSKISTKYTLSWKMSSESKALVEYSVDGVYDVLKTMCKSLDITYLEQRNKQSDGGGHHLLITAIKDTWSHQRRRKRELLRLQAAKHEKDKKAMTADEPDIKRRRIDEVCMESGALEMESINSGSSDISLDECVLKCTMNVVPFLEDNLPVLRLDMKLIEGEKEAMNQVLTYIKNYCK